MREVDKLEATLWEAMKLLETIKIEMGDYLGHEEIAAGDTISGAQCRGGRNMILMRNIDLAEKSGVSGAEISKFETGSRCGIAVMGIKSIQRVLEAN